MKGLWMLFWAVLYEVHNFIRYPSRRWTVACEFCGEQKRARSYNMALTKQSLHVHLADDDQHPDGPEGYDGDWSDGAPVIQFDLGCPACGESWDRKFRGGSGTETVTCPRCDSTWTVENVDPDAGGVDG